MNASTDDYSVNNYLGFMSNNCLESTSTHALFNLFLAGFSTSHFSYKIINHRPQHNKSQATTFLTGMGRLLGLREKNIDADLRECMKKRPRINSQIARIRVKLIQAFYQRINYGHPGNMVEI